MSHHSTSNFWPASKWATSFFEVTTLLMIHRYQRNGTYRYWIVQHWFSILVESMASGILQNNPMYAFYLGSQRICCLPYSSTVICLAASDRRLMFFWYLYDGQPWSQNDSVLAYNDQQKGLSSLELDNSGNDQCLFVRLVYASNKFTHNAFREAFLPAYQKLRFTSLETGRYAVKIKDIV